MNEIRRSHRSPVNRVQSIVEDANYVKSVHDIYNRPLVANMRCGLWYVPPAMRSAECYFKSTDGHTHQWQFSLKRLNLHLVPMIEQYNGIIVVDSTRRGKSMPDALSKTIPIWCAVLNCLLLKIPSDEACFLPKCVSPSEQDQIRSKIDGWVATLDELISIDKLPKLTKPLRPVFVTQDAPLPMYEFAQDEDILPGFHAVVLCTASRRAQDGELAMAGFSYVQGAADDHELWAPKHFTASMLWSDASLREGGLSDSELLRRMDQATTKSKGTAYASVKITQVAPQLFISHSTGEIPTLSGQRVVDMRSGPANSTSSLHVPLSDGKRGSRELSCKLADICLFFEQNADSQLLLVSSPESDFAECVALMLNCRYFDASGVKLPIPAKYVSKSEVTRRNAAIIALTGVVPSRATQNVVGSFLRS